MDLSDDDINLAVAYEGIVDLDDPGHALNDLSLRVEELGVVGNVEPHVANDLGRKYDVFVDFHSVPPGKRSGLENGRSDNPDSDTRHVFLGTTRRDEVLAQKMGWEYHDIYEVAEEEGWE